MSPSMDQGLVTAAMRLAELLARENAALAALDLARAASMLAEKQDAAAGFALAVERAPPLGPDASGPSVHRRDLLALARRLDAAAVENRRLLERGIAVQGRVLAAVARAVPRALAAAALPRYGARGNPAALARRPLAVSFRA